MEKSLSQNYLAVRSRKFREKRKQDPERDKKAREKNNATRNKRLALKREDPEFLKKQRDAVRKWRETHPEKANLRPSPRKRNIKRERAHGAMARDELLDYYVRATGGLPPDATPEIIETRRLIIKLRRLIRKNTNETQQATPPDPGQIH